jgi:hypothetical protein
MLLAEWLEERPDGSISKGKSNTLLPLTASALAFGALAYGFGFGIAGRGETYPSTQTDNISIPNTPTIDAVVLNAVADSLRLVSSAFSGDGSHDSTQFTLDTAGTAIDADSGFASPKFFSSLGAVTTDTVPALDSGAVYVAAVRYKNSAGWSAWSDSLSVTMTSSTLVTGWGAHRPTGWTTWFNVDVTQSDQTGFNDSTLAGDPIFQGTACITPDSTGGGYWGESYLGLTSMYFEWLPGAPNDGRACLTTWRKNTPKYTDIYFYYIIALNRGDQGWPAGTLKTFIRNDGNMSFNMRANEGDSTSWLLGNTTHDYGLGGTNLVTVDSFPKPVAKFDTVELVIRADTSQTYGDSLFLMLNGDTVANWIALGSGDTVTYIGQANIELFDDVLFGPFRGGAPGGTVSDTSRVYFARFGAAVDTAGIGS